MIRQNHHEQDTLPSAVQVMLAADDPLSLTCHSKAAMIHSGVRPLSKHNRLSHTPALHLPTQPAPQCSAPVKAPSSLSSSSCSSSSAPPPAEDSSEIQREAENLPPRRPLKLAPLELPLEVKESHKQKMQSVQQEAKASVRKLEAAGGEPCKPCLRRVNNCGTDGAVKTPTRPPLTTIINPYKDQRRAGRALLLPVRQLQLEDDDRSAGKGVGHKEKHPVPTGLSAHVRSPHAEQISGQSAQSQDISGQSVCPQKVTGQLTQGKKTVNQLLHAEKISGQSAYPPQTVGQSGWAEMSSQSAHPPEITGQSECYEVGGSRRRPRLRRAQRLEEDQSKSGSSAGLGADETRPGHRSSEKTLRQTSRGVETTCCRNHGEIAALCHVQEPVL
ncbi:involucrin [Hoplias malabaricus]|uniref:involucrin n=1 Tax=Hoplias malabaricus TaxID=27720 RepID=UPI0034617DAE